MKYFLQLKDDNEITRVFENDLEFINHVNDFQKQLKEDNDMDMFPCVDNIIDAIKIYKDLYRVYLLGEI
jgi:hypothetical protein